ncbi:uncharacterized protein LOC124144359 isoform X1 [Haliotis rufescens]|uniref:uncharacterized protein LOC124144359 isoform X1 n=1 Tax=Haliotis rufescens TaxID=6454 RepID=UPI001EB0843F|nr:uncharacterized protein LOC124144359 isoform X1 [Haliotis rufescens]
MSLPFYTPEALHLNYRDLNMPSGTYFNFYVDIGGKEQKEYRINDKDVIAVSLHGKHSFFVEESEHEVEGDCGQFQKYPVLPFKIVIRKTYTYPCWFQIFVDGEHVRSFPITTHGLASRTVDGYKVKNEIRELAFSLPRMSLAQTLTKQRQIHAGTVRIVCMEATPSHTETFRQPRTVQKNELPGITMYPQLTKKDMSSVQGGMGVVCREGRTMVELQYDDKCTYRTRTRLCKGPVLEEVVLHYGTQEVLQDMGLSVDMDIAQEVTTRLTNIDINNSTEQHEQQPVVADKGEKPQSNVSPPKSVADKPEPNVDEPDSIVDKPEPRCPLPEDQTKDLKQEQISQLTNDIEMSTPSKNVSRLVKQDQSMSPIAIKHERLKQEVANKDLVEVKCKVEIDEEDDDVVYVETTFIKREPGDLDDSVIYMGDDSCCELDIPEPDISILDLCDDD